VLNAVVLGQARRQIKMAAEVKSLLKSVGDSGSHKDVAQKYKNILNKVLSFKDARLTEAMKAFIEAGKIEIFSTNLKIMTRIIK